MTNSIRNFSSKNLMSLAIAIASAILLLTVLLPVQANTPSTEFLQQQGYSPEMIDMTNVQQSRAEWRGVAPPRRSPAKQFFYNIWTNNITDNIDPMGYTQVRRR